MTRKYELLYVLNGTLGKDQLRAQMANVQSIVSSVAEEITETVEWGRRRLAYEIQDVRDGYYVIVHFDMEPAHADELERLLRINDAVMRYLVVLQEGSFMPSGRRTLADEEADEERMREAALASAEQAAEGEAAPEEPGVEADVPAEEQEAVSDTPAPAEPVEGAAAAPEQAGDESPSDTSSDETAPAEEVVAAPGEDAPAAAGDDPAPSVDEA